MAISQMKRVGILIHRSLYEETVDLLQDLGVMEITTEEDPSKGTEAGPSGYVEELERKIGEIRYCLEFIKKNRLEKPSLVESLFPPPVELTKESFLNQSFNHIPVYRACQSIDEQLNAIRTRLARLVSQGEFLTKIAPVQIPLEDIGTTRTTKSMLLEMPSTILDQFQEKLQRAGNEWSLREFPGIGKKIFVFLIIHRDLVAAVDILFPELSISPITLPQTFEGTPTEALKTVQKKIQQAEKEREAVLKKAWTYVQFEKDLQITFDFVSSQRERHQNENKIRRTQEACFLNGWVLAAKVPLLEQRLATLGKEWVLSQRDPLPNENIPIQLKNHSWVANFDILTRLFGLPNYTEIDPTPFVAVFFFIFFGMCMGDFIYGLLMALVCFMGTSKIKMPESSKRFIRMFGWVGVSSMIYGALTGSWMGDFFDYLPPAFSFLPAIKKGLTIFDPLKNPILIIILALCIGLVQVLIGLLIGFAKEWKRKNYGPAIMDKLGWFIFIVSIVVFVITIRFAPTGKNAASYLVIACALFLVGTQGRSKKNPIQKVLSGIISLYGVTGYLGDVLSYSRLFALGLTSSIIAMLARTLAQVMGETPYIGWLIGLLVLLIFNVFNLLMSGLGAFVHSARLQYVEFFTKFYEDGGKEFQPFKFKTKYVRLSQGRS